MHWLSLIPCLPDVAPGVTLDGAGAASDAAHAAGCQQMLAWWALQFTPRVACLEDAVVLEASASLRLFGGERALRARMLTQREQGLAPAFTALACAPTSLAALALSRHVVSMADEPAQKSAHLASANGFSRPLPVLLDALSLHTLSAIGAHAETLARLGCRTLGDVRRLPRAGLARRFGKGLVAALDQAYGAQAEAHQWVVLPEVFDERLELPWRVESAEALMQGAQHLLLRLQAWLAARHAGVRAIVLRWQHDFGARSAGQGSQLEVRTAQPVRQVDHLARLLAEHLAQTTLLAPVGEIALRATEIESFAPPALSLLPPDASLDTGEGWQAVAERLSVRLGPQQVVRPVLLGDHRPGHMQDWEPVCVDQMAEHVAQQRGTANATRVKPAAAPSASTSSVAPDDTPYNVPLPCWLLGDPQPLHVLHNRPHYQGALRLLAGPHRVESGWWDATSPAMARDYFVAASPRAGLLWVFRERLSPAADAGPAGGEGWFLHGIYG